jgi:sulfite exporter TauE/SafE
LIDLMLYNIGRIASYGVGGALVATIGQAGFLYQGMLPVQTMFLAIANLLLVFVGAYLAGWSRAVLVLERLGAHVWAGARAFISQKSPNSSSPLVLGMAWGWIPCGLVYSAFALALMAGNPMRGALAMTAFGVGTLPSLLVAGLAANAVRRHLQSPLVRAVAGAVVIGFGLLGLYRIPELGEMIRAGVMCLT